MLDHWTTAFAVPLSIVAASAAGGINAVIGTTVGTLLILTFVFKAWRWLFAETEHRVMQQAEEIHRLERDLERERARCDALERRVRTLEQRLGYPPEE